MARNDPPGQSTSIATQELLRLTEANPDGLERIDPVKDLHFKDIDLVEKFQRLSSLESLIGQFDCLNCANFEDHVSWIKPWSWWVLKFCFGRFWKLDPYIIYNFQRKSDPFIPISPILGQVLTKITFFFIKFYQIWANFDLNFVKF